MTQIGDLPGCNRLVTPQSGDVMFENPEALLDLIKLFAHLPKFGPHFATKFCEIGTDGPQMFNRDVVNVVSHNLAPRAFDRKSYQDSHQANANPA